MLKMKDIEKCYSEIVKEYLNKGYILYSKLSGRQSDTQTNIYLTNDKEIVEVRIENLSETVENDLYVHLNGYSLVVEIYDNFKTDTLWNHSGNIIHKTKFYRLGNDYRSKAYSISEKHAVDCILKSYNRFGKTHYTNNRVEIKYDADIIIKIANNHKGFKSVKKNDIKKVEKNSYGYRISFKTKGFNNKELSIRFPR